MFFKLKSIPALPSSLFSLSLNFFISNDFIFGISVLPYINQRVSIFLHAFKLKSNTEQRAAVQYFLYFWGFFCFIVFQYNSSKSAEKKKEIFAIIAILFSDNMASGGRWRDLKLSNGFVHFCGLCMLKKGAILCSFPFVNNDNVG